MTNQVLSVFLKMLWCLQLCKTIVFQLCFENSNIWFLQYVSSTKQCGLWPWVGHVMETAAANLWSNLWSKNKEKITNAVLKLSFYPSTTDVKCLKRDNNLVYNIMPSHQQSKSTMRAQVSNKNLKVWILWAFTFLSSVQNMFAHILPQNFRALYTCFLCTSTLFVSIQLAEHW